ncbi:hypothetical protein HDE_00868 [Halotydeus destructor]|nr:hypothetical protein HDE_00868 [Halotydeus destructor]
MEGLSNSLKFSLDITSDRATIPDLKVGHLENRAWPLDRLLLEEGVITLSFSTDLPLTDVVYDYVSPYSAYAADRKWLDSRTLEVFLSGGSMLLLDLTSVSAPAQPAYSGVFKKSGISGLTKDLAVRVAPESLLQPPHAIRSLKPSEIKSWHSRPAFFIWIRLLNVLFRVDSFNVPGIDREDQIITVSLLSKAVDYCLFLSYDKIEYYSSVYLMAFQALFIPNRTSGLEHFTFARDTLSSHLFKNCASGKAILAAHLILQPLLTGSKLTKIKDSTRKGLSQLLESHRDMQFDSVPPAIRISCLGVFIHDILMTMPKPGAYLMNQLIQLDKLSRSINDGGLITHDLRELSGIIVSQCVKDYDAALLYPGQVLRIADYPNWLLDASQDHVRLSKLPEFRCGNL